MASSNVKKKPYMQTLLYGVVSVALYAALLSNQDLINDNFARGGFFALLPIVAAFLFSFVHGHFTGHFWTVMGVEASKKKMEVK